MHAWLIGRMAPGLSLGMVGWRVVHTTRVMAIANPHHESWLLLLFFICAGWGLQLCYTWSIKLEEFLSSRHLAVFVQPCAVQHPSLLSRIYLMMHKIICNHSLKLSETPGHSECTPRCRPMLASAVNVQWWLCDPWVKVERGCAVYGSKDWAPGSH